MRTLLTIATALLLSSSVAFAEPVTSAQPRADALTAGLGTLNAQERNLLAPYLKQGPVVLTEFSNAQTELPAIIYAVPVDAPAGTVANVIAGPQDYPEFMQALHAVDIQSAHGQIMSYEWTWTIALFTLASVNYMTTFPSRGNPSGFRFDVRITEGDLGMGRMMWRIYPDGPEHSVMVFSSRLDSRNANYITQQLAKGGNAVNRTINVTLATLMLLEVKAEAERRAGLEAQAPPVKPLRRPDIDMKSLARLLLRGDLVLLNLNGITLNQITVVGRMGSSGERLRQIMADPELFAKSVIHGSSAEVLEQKDGETHFKWKVSLPLIGARGEMVLRPSDTVIELDGVSGNFADGRWRTDTFRFAAKDTGVISWAIFDPGDTTKLLRRLITGNPYFSHGLAAAIQLMMIRTLRTRAQQTRQ